ncbi:MAG: hypothetical protein ACJA1P_000043 [Maribacter sp.]|jgi:hypothetical protein
MNKVVDYILKNTETGKELFVIAVKAQITIGSRTSGAINVRVVMQEYPCAAAL